jgi:hypothetical protein
MRSAEPFIIYISIKSICCDKIKHEEKVSQTDESLLAGP